MGVQTGRFPLPEQLQLVRFCRLQLAMGTGKTSLAYRIARCHATREMDMTPWMGVCWVWVAGVVQGGECRPGKDCRDHRQAVPQTKFSDGKIVGFPSFARVAVGDQQKRRKRRKE